MSKLMKILAFIIFFTMITMFTGVVSAANLTVNHGNSIQSVINNDSNNYIIAGNNLTDTLSEIASLSSNNTTITENDTTSTEIQDVITVDTTGIVMSNSTSNCGPASLATVLQKMGINVSQDVLTDIAGTDENGTTMYGIAQAAQQQGVITKGLKLTVNELKPGNIVYLLSESVGHYSIITKVNGTVVYLADTDFGNINMTLKNFTVAYIQNTTNGYGYTMVVTNDTNNPQLSNNNTLTDDEMKAIKGTGSIIKEWNNGWNNPRIKSIANPILCKFSGSWKIYGFGIWQWMTQNMQYHKHLNTLHSIDEVLNSHKANCCEMARLVVCLARAMGISAANVRYVHKIPRTYEKYGWMPGHYWAQIKWGPGALDWIDLDCTLLFYIHGDDARHYGGAMDLKGRFNGPWKYREYIYTKQYPTF